MKEALGEEEGRAGAASAREVLGGIQDLDFNSERMRRRIMSSGTREPVCMWDSASWPAIGMLSEAPIDHGGNAGWKTYRLLEVNGTYLRAFCCEQHCAKDPRSSQRTIEENVS